MQAGMKPSEAMVRFFITGTAEKCTVEEFPLQRKKNEKNNIIIDCLCTGWDIDFTGD